MPYYDTLTESEYNGLIEADYNALLELLVIVSTVPLMFKDGLLIFCLGRAWFGPTCPGACVPSAPTCLALRRSDFATCGGAVVGACGVTPAWDGHLSYDGSQWASTLACTPSGLKVTATVTASGSTYTLTVKTAALVTLWVGTHTGTNPTGTYTRTSGCDTTQLMFMF